jgi:tRNA G18 (ribose-2'-O)-methylase SpoU
MPCSFLIIANISKKENIKKILVSANAFGVAEVFIVGQPTLELDTICAQGFAKHQPLGVKGAVPAITFRRFDSLPECRNYCQQIGCSICGIEILDSAEDINTNPFRGDTAFMLGNEGSGLSKKQIEYCDHFVFIPHYGGGTASLNVACAGSVVMHKFAVWAQSQNREVRGDAFTYSPTTLDMYHPLPNASRIQEQVLGHGKKSEGARPGPLTVIGGDA